jgi:hypothetical protein
VEKIADKRNTSPETIMKTIAAYAQRCNDAHSHIGEKAECGDYVGLTALFEADLAYLKKGPLSCLDDVGIYRDAVNFCLRK